MTSAPAALAAACCLALPALWLPGSAGSAPPAIATYQDAVGDAAMGPDIGTVTVTDEAGRLTFTVDLANRLALLGGESVQIYLETDPAGAGDDYLLSAFDSASLPFLARWGGSSWVIVRYLDDTSYIEGIATFHLSRSDVAASGPFGLAVASFANDDMSSFVDVAPDEARFSASRWIFAPAPAPAEPSLPAPPPPSLPAITLPAPLPLAEPPLQPVAPPPASERLQAAGLTFSPSAPRAGKRFTAQLLVKRGGGLATLAAVSCGANVGRQKLRVLGTRLAHGLAACTWAVPKRVGGRTLVGQVRASAASETTSRAFRQIVRRG